MEGDKKQNKLKICYTLKGWLGQAVWLAGLADSVFRSPPMLFTIFCENKQKNKDGDQKN